MCYATKYLMDRSGVIFISIDDHEQSKLTSLLIEIFGEENFVNQIIWQKKYSPQNDAKWLSGNHDLITCVAKNKELWRQTLLERTEEQNARYRNPDNGPRGPWKSSGLDVKTYSSEFMFLMKMR
ncbi:MAG: DNA methyltransferase [Myxococcota bacterium]